MITNTLDKVSKSSLALINGWATAAVTTCGDYIKLNPAGGVVIIRQIGSVWYWVDASEECKQQKFYK